MQGKINSEFIDSINHCTELAAVSSQPSQEVVVAPRSKSRPHILVDALSARLHIHQGRQVDHIAFIRWRQGLGRLTSFESACCFFEARIRSPKPCLPPASCSYRQSFPPTAIHGITVNPLSFSSAQAGAYRSLRSWPWSRRNWLCCWSFTTD
ncbi:hypothetical protein MPH_10338 [Macrophomina phaseolina MS6]|uniref:Uncharacterized protein n=1 Tax=Macrophomina phaseolina (strain MS6) TaxID=1126212 RepID=K2RDD2_MACPH|nr:hypothetical protein MPH_10338 [Macrophomina phaseolina MS6]